MAMVRNFGVMFHKFKAIGGFNNGFYGKEIDDEVI
jgi:hypothetical protein